MSSDTSNALNAIGTLIGYIGTEVATDDFFERLLWPRRAYSNFSLKHIPQVALLMPMGGPLHKAALTTLDEFYKHGLYQRHQQGHMLGTAFFRDCGLKYREWDCLKEGDGSSEEKKDGKSYMQEWVRNGLWARSVIRTPFPEWVFRRQRSELDVGSDDEMGEAKQQRIAPARVRQKVFVAHLKVFKLAGNEKIAKSIPDDAHRPTIRTYLALFTTETSAIIISIIIGVRWKSLWSLLYLLPLLLKLISTVFTLSREKLDIPDSRPGTCPPSSTPAKKDDEDEKKIFSIRNPSGGFVVIEGPSSLILPFFRHHGHPARSRTREVLLIAMVVSFTLVFPVGLVCSTLWMNNTMQTIWVGYQLYATLAMYVYRYAGGYEWCTTEERIGKALFENEAASNVGIVRFGRKKGVGMGATLERVFYNRYGEAKAATDELVERRRRSHLLGTRELPVDEKQVSYQVEAK